MSEGAPRPPTREELEGRLLWIPIDEARAIKNQWGVEEHRDGDDSRPFVGHLPTMMHSEGLDLTIYAERAMEKGYDPEIVEEIFNAGMKAAGLARLLAQNGAGLTE
jgi:hypothetical protein